MVKTNSEYRSIRKKLMAAIAMVLVASIMVVSSSYAWFTLSTAPEVKGITTSVGSNGNLEMALRTVSDVNTIQTSTGVTDTVEANAYWGNLVDVTDASYGMSSIALAPARLNAAFDAGSSIKGDVVYEDVKAAAGTYTEGGTYNNETIKKVEETAPAGTDGKATYKITTEGWVSKVYKFTTSSGYLQTPEYGEDGRVSQLNANTVAANYIETDTGAGFGGTDYGVRAIGITSSISPEALALRNAKQTVNAAIDGAQTSGKLSMKNDAVPMANIIVQNKLNAGFTYKQEHTDAVKTAVTNLTKVVENLEAALKQAVVAVGLSQGHTFTSDKVTLSSTAITVDGYTLDWDGDGAVGKIPDRTAQYNALLAAVAKLETMTGKLTTATTNIGNIANPAAPTYTELTDAMSTLLSTSDVVILANGKQYTMASGKDELMGMATALIGGNAVIQLNGGIYADIAEFVGNFSQGGVSMEVDTTGTDYANMVTQVFGSPKAAVTFTMATNATAPATGFHLVYVKGWMASLTVANESQASTMITNTYGYLLDLAFRTNAADSGLLLQTEAVDRVSENYGEESATMGAGSFMKFKPEATDFTLDQVANLMKAIRVVLTDDDGIIYGIAALDVDSALTKITKDGAAVVYDEKVHKYFIEETVDGTATKYAAEFVADAEGYIKAPLYLYSYAIDNGVVTLGNKINGGSITALTQNAAKALTTLVYMDGDKVGNSDVAISGNSMTGSMNLQFASTATLVPMDYTFSTADKLKTPTVSIDGNNMTISTVEGATSYDVYINGNMVGNVTQTSGNLSTLLGDATKGFEDMTVRISVVAKGENKTPSNRSNEVSWTVPASQG